jgi:hypothetical protein
MRKEPNRLNAILGAGDAATASGDDAKARQYYSAAVALASEPRVTRPGVSQARAFLVSAK